VIEAQTVQPSLTTPRVSKNYLTPQDIASYMGVTTRDREIFTAMIPYLSLRDNVVVLVGQTTGLSHKNSFGNLNIMRVTSPY
jgi:hypothetical protein